MLRVRDWFGHLGLSEGWSVAGAILVGLLAAWILGELLRMLGSALLSKVARPEQKWLSAIERHRVLRSFGWVLAVIVADSSVAPLLATWPKASSLTKTFFDSALVIAVTVALTRMIRAIVQALEIQEGKERRLPLQALGQAAQLTVWTYATIVLLSVVTHRNVTTLLTGLTALGAVLVYVFRDPILGWTAGVQIAANDLARIGDWITVPAHDADGRVIEIALTTIKVRNWDKTISVVPTYALVSQGFRNWHGMYESGGRRIKRALSVDANSVRVCDDSLRARLQTNGMLRAAKEDASQHETNLTLFRAWLEAWLHEHPAINHEMTTMVRELAPEGRGIPVEIYAFSSDTAWVAYEHLQADIFDNAVVMLPAFDLRLFQEPTGDDVRAFTFGDDSNRNGQ